MGKFCGFMVHQLAILFLYIFEHVFVEKSQPTKVIATRHGLYVSLPHFFRQNAPIYSIARFLGMGR